MCLTAPCCRRKNTMELYITAENPKAPFFHAQTGIQISSNRKPDQSTAAFLPFHQTLFCFRKKRGERDFQIKGTVGRHLQTYSKTGMIGKTLKTVKVERVILCIEHVFLIWMGPWPIR